MAKINQNFSAHVTSTAFNLSLSKQMIRMLSWVATGKHITDHGCHIEFSTHCTYFATGNSLKERGLICSPDKKHPGGYELTDTGKLVIELLKMAGLFDVSANANKRAA